MDAAAARRLFRAFYPDVEAEDPADYFGANSSVVDALTCGWLYWPRLIEVHGAVFLAINGNDEDYVAERLAAATDRSHSAPGFSWAEVVDSFNFFELEYMFGLVVPPFELLEDVVQQLGAVLVETWSARLAATYPDRRFSVTLLPADETLVLATRVQVTQTSPPLEAPAGW